MIRKRILSTILAVSLLLPICAISTAPKAQAFAPALVAGYEIYTLLASSLAASGFVITVLGASVEDILNACKDLWNEFKNARGYGSVRDDELLGDDWLTIRENSLQVNRETAQYFKEFVDFVRGKVTATDEVFPIASGTNSSIGGTPVEFTFVVNKYNSGTIAPKWGTRIKIGEFIKVGQDVFGVEQDGRYTVLTINGEKVFSGYPALSGFSGLVFGYHEDTLRPYYSLYAESWDSPIPSQWGIQNVREPFGKDGDVKVGSFSIGLTAPETVTMPDVANMTDGQSMVISTGIAADSKEDLLQKILEAIQTGTLTATATVEETVDVPGTGEVEKPSSILGFLTGALMGILNKILEGILNIPVAIGGFFDTIGRTLSGIWDSVLEIPNTIGKAVTATLTGIKDLAVSLVVPREAAVTELKAKVDATFPIFNDFKQFGTDFMTTLERPDLSASQLALTPLVDLGKKESRGKEYGTAVINFLDFRWYVEKYKKTVDDVIVGFFWMLVLWNLYGRLPSLLNGSTGTLISYEHSSFKRKE